MKIDRVMKALFVLIGFLCCSLWSVAAYAMDSEVTRRNLKDIGGFYLLVEALQPNFSELAAGQGITREKVTMEVEHSLQKAGIKVLPQDQWLKTRGRPAIYINVNTHREKDMVAYNISVEVRQIVLTDSNQPVKTYVRTWGTTMTGLTKADKLDVIRQNTLRLVDSFVEAYRAANKK